MKSIVYRLRGNRGERALLRKELVAIHHEFNGEPGIGLRVQIIETVVVIDIKMAGNGNRETAQVLRGKMLYVDRKDIKLPKGHYLVQDLIGLTIVDADTGVTYGTLTDVSQTGSNAVYHMRTEKGEVLIPAIPDVIIEVNLKKDILRLRPMKGLLDDDEI